MSRKIFFLVLIFISITINCFAATYYISPSGNDLTGNGSTGNPWKSFSKAFGEMSAADTLILKDGTYSIATGTGVINISGTGSAQPPSGTSTSAMTIIQAENLGGSILDGTGAGTGASTNASIFLGRSDTVQSYIKIDGIKALTSVMLYNADYCYLKNSAINADLGIGSTDHTDSSDYNLIEDSWIWAEDKRVIAISYEGRYNIWRRVVVRGDGCDEAYCLGSGNPNVGITTYNSQYTLMQNIIVIDRILNGGEPYGDFASAQHAGGANDYPLTGNQWIGCISVNSEDVAFHLEADDVISPSHYISNSVAISPVSAGFILSGDNGTILENSTVINLEASLSAALWRFGPDTSTSNTLRSVLHVLVYIRFHAIG